MVELRPNRILNTKSMLLTIMLYFSIETNVGMLCTRKNYLPLNAFDGKLQGDTKADRTFLLTPDFMQIFLDFT